MADPVALSVCPRGHQQAHVVRRGILRSLAAARGPRERPWRAGPTGRGLWIEAHGSDAVCIPTRLPGPAGRGNLATSRRRGRGNVGRRLGVGRGSPAAVRGRGRGRRHLVMHARAWHERKGAWRAGQVQHGSYMAARGAPLQTSAAWKTARLARLSAWSQALRWWRPRPMRSTLARGPWRRRAAAG